MNIGLLIQGPLRSIGRHGGTCMVPASSVTNNDIVDFDAIPLIKQLISKNGYLFNEVVISTWEGEECKSHIPGSKIYYFKDKALAIKKETRGFQLHKAVENNNMQKQFHGTLKGLEKFSESIDYIIKIRTDCSVDLKSLIDYVKNIDLNKIIIPYLIRGKNWVPDFYFCGSRTNLIEFFGILSNDVEILSTSPHEQIVLKYAKGKYFNKIGVSKRWYTKPNNTESTKIFNYMFNNIFYPGPETVLREIIWRGHGWSSEFQSEVDGYCFTWPNLYNNQSIDCKYDKLLFSKKSILIEKVFQKASNVIFSNILKLYNLITKNLP